MKTLSIIAIIAATATPALAEIDINDRIEKGTYSAVDLHDRAGDQFAQNDIADRTEGKFAAVDLHDRAGDQFAALDLADRAHA